MGGNTLLVRNNGGSADWPSKVLHDVRGCIEGGLNRDRLRAMAGFIEGLPMTWRDDRHPWQVPVIRHVDGRTACIGYVLHAGGGGLGLMEYDKPAPEGVVEGYHLTGYGLCCWGWGSNNGMANVANNGLVAGLQAVLTAEPVGRGAVRGVALRDVTTAHVAAAILAFLDCENAEGAWRAAVEAPAARSAGREVLRLASVAERDAETASSKEAPADEPAAADEAMPAPEAAGAADKARFDRLFAAERFDEAAALCEQRAADLEAEADRAAAEAATWGKRLNAARAMRS